MLALSLYSENLALLWPRYRTLRPVDLQPQLTSAVARPEERKFLGFSISNDGSERRIAPKALDKFKEWVREMTRSIRGLSLSQIIEKLAPYLIVWRSYFGFCPRIPIKGELSHVEFAASSMEGIYCSSPSTAHTMSGNASVE